MSHIGSIELLLLMHKNVLVLKKDETFKCGPGGHSVFDSLCFRTGIMTASLQIFWDQGEKLKILV